MRWVPRIYRPVLIHMTCFHFHLTTTTRGAFHTPRGAPQKESRTPPSHTNPALTGAPEIHAHKRVPCTPALALPVQPHFFLSTRATHAHQLQPAALAFVSYGFVLVRVRVTGPPSEKQRDQLYHGRLIETCLTINCTILI